MTDYRDVPIFINTRDRVLDLRKMVAWLENAGQKRIIFLDNASTYEPLLDYLNQTPHEVVRLTRNLGKLALWKSGLVPNRPFIYSDPDVVPIAHCPTNLVEVMLDLLGRCAPWQKIGLGLYLADVPSGMKSLEWERSLVSKRLPRFERDGDPPLFDSLVDTTFAMYSAKCPFGFSALRTGYPFQGRHMPWYPAANMAERTERAFYLLRAEGGPLFSSWKEGTQV